MRKKSQAPETGRKTVSAVTQPGTKQTNKHTKTTTKTQHIFILALQRQKGVSSPEIVFPPEGFPVSPSKL